ncbi:MAG: 4-hydroxythreonine-4-phosphate dehydrogenase PdxA [Lachnospiraceae bacterium]|nr:4-hydroxythreonine-4-phosphate dehydrogenase PdxA [Lachnospiraceae bacterium]
MATNTDYKPIIGVLLGDSTGVGPEIVAKCMVAKVYDEVCRPIFIGDLRIVAEGLKTFGGEATYYGIENVEDADWSKGYPVLDTKDQDPARIKMGAPDPYCGAAGVEAFKLACRLCKEGKIEGFCFGPYHKAAMIEGGCEFESEHTLIAHELGATRYCETNVVDGLMTVRCTSHVPVKEISDHLCIDRVLEISTLGYETAVNMGIENPRLGVAGLNPHCGENGLCGMEEIEIISPAIKILQERGINAIGPISSDILFIRAFKKREFDVAVTMYHDQGQIATKLHGFEGGITVSGGQPYPVVTCGHGTAYGRAGQGRASEKSFENAIRMTARMCVARKAKEA